MSDEKEVSSANEDQSDRRHCRIMVALSVTLILTFVNLTFSQFSLPGRAVEEFTHKV